MTGPSNHSPSAPVVSDSVAAPIRQHQARRIERMKSLVAALQKEDLARDQIAALISVGPSGTRKYLTALNAAGILEYRGPADPAQRYASPPIYGLVKSSARVAAFLAAVCAGKVKHGSGKAKAKKKPDPTRHFHIMADDAAFLVRVRRAPVGPDPLALPPAFFRPAAQQGQVCA